MRERGNRKRQWKEPLKTLLHPLTLKPVRFASFTGVGLQKRLIDCLAGHNFFAGGDQRNCSGGGV